MSNRPETSSNKIEKNNEESEPYPIPPILPVLPVRNVILFPGLVVPLLVARQNGIRLVEETMSGDRTIALVAQKDPLVEDPTVNDIYNLGVACSLIRMVKMPEGPVNILVQGLERIKLQKIIREKPFIQAKIEILQEKEKETIKLKALAMNLLNQFQKMVSLNPNLPDQLSIIALNLKETGRLVDLVASTLNLSHEERQKILTDLDVNSRLKQVQNALVKEVEILELESQIQAKVKEEWSQGQREYFLRRQLETIKKELGEGDDPSRELEELDKKLQCCEMPEEARVEAQRELKRLHKIPPGSAEYPVSKNYLDWLVAMPWNKQTEDHLDIKQARLVLDEDHYNLEKVKERILEFLAIRHFKKSVKGPLLCFVGPPGVGKTSLGKSIARAMDRKFIRISLGGVHDEADIRGHRRTYIGAMPGRIIQGIKRAGTCNPVFMLDEVDKLGSDYRGDPSSALLEVLDPEQNHTFCDHYLDVPFDLSKVMFITTANVLHTIPPPLKDRMEVIQIPGYTEEEKINIAVKYLIPKQIIENGLKGKGISFDTKAIYKIIEDYTREAGVRNLEREIGNIIRKIVLRMAEGEKHPNKIKIGAQKVRSLLGAARFYREGAGRITEPGIAMGLSWTPSGGEVLFVEATQMTGKGGLTLTGQMGDVMKESAQAALSYIRANAKDFDIPENIFNNSEFHIHVPEGAIPKDGPSAGVTMLVALTSLLQNVKVREDTGMTGEITLRGKILPVGGIKEKLLAAKRAGIKRIIIPQKNHNDLLDLPSEITENINVILADKVEDALKEALLSV